VGKYATLTVQPARVGEGDLLTYCIRLNLDALEAEIPPEVSIHLPAGITEPRFTGVGWLCEQKMGTHAGSFVLHIDLFCRSAIVQARPVPVMLWITAVAPEATGDIQACMEVHFKEQGEMICINSQVVRTD